VTVQAPPRLGPIFAVVTAGVVMSNLDLFIVNVALPVVGEHFHGTSLSSLSWILNAYAVIFAALLIPAGSLADRTGPRRAYLLGIAVFTVASLLCALAPTVWALIAARVLQAAGAAMLIPASLGILLAVAPPEKRVATVRAWTAASGVAAALGPVAGGLLTALDWRWVFLVNLPIGLATLIAGPRVLPVAEGRPSSPRPDLTGAGVLTASIALLTLGLVKTNDWTAAQLLACFGAAVALLVWFLRRSAAHEAPIVPMSLFRIPAFGKATLANLLFAVAFSMMLLSVVLWCQGVWHWSALRTGLAVAPGPLMVPALAIGAGPITRRIGAGPVAAAGCFFFALGNLWWITQAGLSPSYVQGMLPGMILTGIGVGLALPTLVGAAVTALPPQSFATGSAVVTMARQIGSVLGVAALVAILGAAGTPSAGFDHGWLLAIAASAATAAGALTIRR
jgi:EmrB/QacA subfamily drug resistance transporter